MNGTFKNPCTASVCMSALGLAFLSSREMAAMSVTAPVSLFTSMSETIIVSSRSASLTCSGVTAPDSPGVRRVTS